MSDRRGRRHAWRVGLAFFSIYVVWGSTFLVIRTALEHLPPLFLCGARLLVAGVVLAALAWRARAPWPRGIEWRNAALVGLLLPAIGNGSVTIAETHVASGLVALLVASIPMWMALFAALGPHPIPLRPRVVAGLVTGLVGIALLVGPGHLAGARGGIGWTLVPIVGSISWAWGSLWSGRVRMPASPLVSTAVGMTAGGLVLLGASVAGGEWRRLGPAAFSPASLVALAYLSLFGSVIAFTAYLWLLRNVPPTRVSTYAFVNPVVAVTLGALLAGESFDGRVAIAATLVVAAVALIVTTQAPARVVSTARASADAEPGMAEPAA
ncbi:MAG: EamA family transporter [Candidatus Eisenbacteria bacterium]